MPKSHALEATNRLKRMTNRIECIKSSAIRKIMDKASQRSEVVNLSIGQPDFLVPKEVKDSLKKSIDDNYTGYTPSAGITGLRDKIIKKHNTEDAIVTSGVTAAIFLTYSTLLEAGDELIIPEPYFVVYPDLCKFLNAKPVIVNTNKDFSLDIKAIESAITNKTKAIIINHPNNPTGKIYSQEELSELVQIANENDLWIISDEVYEAFDYENKFQSIKELYEKVIVLNGFSKNLSMTGLRIGYATGPREIIKDMVKLQQYSFVCAPSISQWAVLENFDLKINETIEKFRKRRNRVYDKLNRHFNLTFPRGAFYFFLGLPKNVTGEEFADKCLENNLLIVPGEAFTKEKNYVRISYATDPNTLDRGCEILIKTLNEMKNGT